MKKTFFLLAGLVPASGAASVTDVKFTSRSIMNIAQTTPVDPTLYYLFTEHFRYDRNEPSDHHAPKERLRHLGRESRSALTIMVWGGATTEADDIARYLLPFGKTQLVVREGYAATVPATNQNVDVPGNQDIVAENFNITTKKQNFYSTLSFKPKQTFVGIGFSGYWQMSNKIWLAFDAPLVHVKNTVDLLETVTSDGGGPVVQSTSAASEGFDNTPFYGNMQAAFASPHMLYGKIDGPQSKTRFAYINLKIGYTYLFEEDRSVQMYGGLILPTGNKPEGIYFFEPLVGNNQHFGLLVGSYFTRRYETKKFAVNIWVDSNTQFLFANTQTRSIDLAGKPWSRYLGIYANDAQRQKDAATSTGTAQMRYQTWGINYFTQRVKVNPHFSTDLIFNASFELPRHGGLDFGLRCYWQQDEHLTLKDPWVLGPMIGKLSDANVVNPGECAPERGINDMYSTIVNATTAVAPAITSAPFYITEDQLDLTSASQPFRSDYTVYGALHRIFDEGKLSQCVAQIGASYIIGSNNSTANRWQLWFGGSRYF